MSELDDFLNMVVNDSVNGGSYNERASRQYEQNRRPTLCADCNDYPFFCEHPQPIASNLRHCANCGELADGWWCSTRCRREEDGDERDHGDGDDT